MEELLDSLLSIIVKYRATDVHFTLRDDKLKMSVRGNIGIIDIKERFDVTLFHYLKFISHLDLGVSNVPQSGNFAYFYQGKELFFRFSFIQTNQLQTAVLRILNNHQAIKLVDLSKQLEQYKTFQKWCSFRSGLTIISGPTGSGKTTTLHAMLEEISENHQLKVITLEDPIEIQSDNYLQLQINEKANFTYENGIKQLLRHDPDVIMIGEIRDCETAQSLIRCALSGHMVFTTLHAKTCKEAILRLLDFNISKNDLKEVLTGVTNQRIYPSKNRKGRVCVYEVVDKKELEFYFQQQEFQGNHNSIYQEIEKSVEEGWVAKKEAQKDNINH